MKTVTNFRSDEGYHHTYNENPGLEILDSLDNENFHVNVAIMLLLSVILIHILFYLAFLGVD